MKWLIYAIVVTMAASPLAAGAEPVPSGARPVEGAELRKIYAGRSMVWSHKDAAYFAPSGKVKTVFTNDTDSSTPDRWTGYASGSWSVKGNRVCWNVSGMGMNMRTKAVEPIRANTACWEWYKAGKTYYTRWSHGPKFNTTAISRFRSGDRVSGWYEEYRAKFKGPTP